MRDESKTLQRALSHDVCWPGDVLAVYRDRLAGRECFNLNRIRLNAGLPLVAVFCGVNDLVTGGRRGAGYSTRHKLPAVVRYVEVTDPFRLVVVQIGHQHVALLNSSEVDDNRLIPALNGHESAGVKHGRKSLWPFCVRAFNGSGFNRDFCGHPNGCERLRHSPVPPVAAWWFPPLALASLAQV